MFTKEQVESMEKDLRKMKSNQELVKVEDMNQIQCNVLSIMHERIVGEFRITKGLEPKKAAPIIYETLTQEKLDAILATLVKASEGLVEHAKANME